MAKYVASVLWTLKDGEDFAKGRYSRGHTISFDGGTELAASASPHVVGKWAVEAAVDPEEMFVAALSNCHMLTFLHKARLAGFVATRYADDAEGVMGEVAPGRMAPCGRGTPGRGRSPPPRNSTTCTTRRTRSASSPIR
jgi:organic hydroperoxide reductase OsmC/OhrA